MIRCVVKGLRGLKTVVDVGHVGKVLSIVGSVMRV
jgi:hypothetical protein